MYRVFKEDQCEQGLERQAGIPGRDQTPLTIQHSKGHTGLSSSDPRAENYQPYYMQNIFLQAKAKEMYPLPKPI